MILLSFKGYYGFLLKKNITVLFLFALSSLLPAKSIYAGTGRVEVRGRDIYVDGKNYTVKGIHYSPWKPNTGPYKGYPYPSAPEVDADLKLIKEANANTILVTDAPLYVLDKAEKYQLKVLYTFSINWVGVNDSSLIRQTDSIFNIVLSLRSKKALLGWVIGNNIPENVLIKSGSKVYESAIRSIYGSIKKADPAHPVTHSNWIPAKSLDLGFLDMISFNVYPAWPPEVAAQGYLQYIRNVIRPIAGSKPLLITRFGVSSLEGGEDGQERLIRQCWEDIEKAGACGGFVFSFVDQWWRNYDNPNSEDPYRLRQPSPADEFSHDKDPEEHYGLMTVDRKPKRAYHAVQQMYKGSMMVSPVAIVAIITGLIVIAVIIAWYRSKIDQDPFQKSFEHYTS